MVNRARARPGRTRLGCLLMLAVLAAVGYFGSNVGRVYFRFYEIQDAMAQEVRFAARTQDAMIVSHLRAKADSIGLPEGAQTINVYRKGKQIWIWAHYFEIIELPGRVETLELAPHAEGTF